MEIRKEVTVYRVHKQCKSCKKGIMLCGTQALASNPPKFQHKCNNCEAVDYYLKMYPTTEYKEK